MAENTARLGDEARAKIARAWPDLLYAVASGGNIGEACAAAGVSRSAVYAYQAEFPEARTQWERAREESADSFADMVAGILNNPIDDAQVARVRMDGYRWLAAKRNPRVYSDKQQIDMNVRTVDLTRVIADARKRLEASRVVEGAVVRPAIAHRTESLITSESVPALSDLL